MNIRIEPFTVEPINGVEGIAPAITGSVAGGPDADAHSGPITYWGLYLGDRYITHSSTRELAEKTKDWMEKWLKGVN